MEIARYFGATLRMRMFSAFQVQVDQENEMENLRARCAGRSHIRPDQKHAYTSMQVQIPIHRSWKVPMIGNTEIVHYAVQFISGPAEEIILSKTLNARTFFFGSTIFSRLAHIHSFFFFCILRFIFDPQHTSNISGFEEFFSHIF